MLTRRELIDRAEARLRARGGDEEGLEASRCFLRAMLVGVDDAAAVPEDLVDRVSEFLKIDRDDLVNPPALRRTSTRPPSTGFALQAPPGERRRRVLFLGRNDPARVAMIDAVARAVLADDVEVRAASLTPTALDPRVLRVLRHAGYATDGITVRTVTVDDMSWADLVVTVGGEREAWERFLPRSIPHQHESIDDPVALSRAITAEQDQLDPFRAVLRNIEKLLSAMRPPRSSRMPVASPSARPSWPKVPSLRPTPLPQIDEEPAPSVPNSVRVRSK